MPRVRASDVELYYQEAGTGSEPLVLVHGWIASSRNWAETIPRLPLGRYHVYAFDLRGAGRSDHPASGHSPQQYAADIAAAMTALGVEAFHFVGHSMGGLVGMQLALEHPDRLRKLVLVAPVASGGLPYPGLMAPVLAARRDAARYRAFYELVRERPLPERLEDIIVEDALGCSEGHAEGSVPAMCGLNLTERLGEVRAPTLMVVGDRDGLRPFNLADAARIPNCALHVFYRVGHWLPFEVPQEFADLLVDFLDNGTAPPVDPEKRAAQFQALLGAAN
jgi:pimeloyl-ACP methyl ester carboxylesterase